MIEDPGILPLESSVSIVDHSHLEAALFTIQLTLPKQGSLIGCDISTDTYYKILFICTFTPDTTPSASLLLHGHCNSSFWILSINGQEFITARATATYIHSLRQPGSSSFILPIFARRAASHRTSLERNRVLFNQAHFSNLTVPSNEPCMSTTIVPMGLKVVTCPIHPATPAHFGQTMHMPHAADWKEALFINYSKMLATGTFGAPMLCTDTPVGVGGKVSV